MQIWCYIAISSFFYSMHKKFGEKECYVPNYKEMQPEMLGHEKNGTAKAAASNDASLWMIVVLMIAL